MLLLAASLFFAEPAPLEMPRAEAYIVRENDTLRLKDRYRRLDLWTSQTVDGRWYDELGRVFTLSRLVYAAPAVDHHQTLTRVDYAKERRLLKAKDIEGLRAAIQLLSPVPVADEPFSPRQGIRGYRDVFYWQGTNASAIVCSYLPEKSAHWRLVTWELAQDDLIHPMMLEFEEKFLIKNRERAIVGEEVADKKRQRRREEPGERELLRRDARHSIHLYDEWNSVEAEEFSVLHALPKYSGFITRLTNELAVMRAEYTKTVPSPIDGSNVLAVARIFASREDYVDTVDSNMTWTAAYWSPERREIVAYLPQDGDLKLLRTFRHEAFHQYLSYATSMIPASPWFNEGYAQYFEDMESDYWGDAITVTKEWLESVCALLPAIMAMDYSQFYAGSSEERYLKYRLAWSIAYFIEKGASNVRFEPFKNLKRDYISELLKTQDMRKATNAAFGNDDNLKLFVREWMRFYLN